MTTTATETERTILRAASNLLREQGIELARSAHREDERRAANAALLACVNIESYLSALDDLDRPF